MTESEHVLMEKEVLAALALLRDWSRNGRPLEGYRFGYGREFLASLLGFTWYSETISTERFRLLYTASGSDILKQIHGPYGWILIQAMIKKRKAKRSTQ